jgi:hypothetical protein
VASASGFVNGRYPYEAFTNTNVDDNDCWQVVTASATDGYSDTDGTYTGSERLSSSTPLGEWLKLKSPIAFKLKSYKIIARNSSSYYSSQAPRDAEIWGSNDDTNWTKITEHSGLEFNSQTDSSSFNVSFDNEKYFKYHAIIVTKNNADEFFAVAIGEWELYGIPEYDPEADGTDVIARSVPNVPNTDWLEVYYDGRDFSGTPTSITDKSGNNITATANNITIDTTYQSFEFTQSPKSNIIADNVSFVSGDQQHSIALWFRLKNKNQHNLLFDYRAAGGSTTTGTATGLYVRSYNTNLQFFHQGTDKEVDFDFIPNTWYHLIGTYAGGGGFSGSTIYINGIDVGGSMSGTNTVLDLPGTGTITIGDYLHASYGMGDGSIANFRLFNRALTSDEVWQLYAYQKEYFGHGNLDMTLKSGVLDVHGNIKVNNYPFSSAASLQVGTTQNQSLNNTQFELVTFNNVNVDTINGWDTNLNRYKPSVPGYYLVTAQRFNIETTSGFVVCNIRKNGVDVSTCTIVGSNASYPMGGATALVYLNGTTDYVDVTGYAHATININTARLLRIIHVSF